MQEKRGKIMPELNHDYQIGRNYADDIMTQWGNDIGSTVIETMARTHNNEKGYEPFTGKKPHYSDEFMRGLWHRMSEILETA